MKERIFIVLGALALLLGAAAPGFSADSHTVPAGPAGGREQTGAASSGKMILLLKDPATSATVTVPLFSATTSSRPVAQVNNDEITVEDIRTAVAEMHQQPVENRKDAGNQAPKINFDELLNRLIGVQLIVQEAKNIGLNELPEIKGAADVFSKVTLRNLLREELWKDISVNEKEVEKIYQEDAQQVKMTLIVLKKKQDATKALAEIKGGKDFDKVVAAADKNKKVLAKEAGVFFKINELDSAIAAEIPKMKTGDISPVLKFVRKGKTVFGFFRLDEHQTVDNEEARIAARNKVLQDGKIEVVRKYLRLLYKEGVKMDEKLRDSLDYGPTGPGLAKLMEDKRVVAEIEGEDPITVGELSEALEDKFYHGMKNINSEKIKKLKKEAFETLMEKKLLYREARKRGIDKTETYKTMLADYERSTLFDAFIKRVVVPEIKMSEDELKTYYDDHADSYRTSEMVKVRALAFRNKTNATVVLEKLRKGADYDWVKSNAEGLIEKNDDQSLPFDDDQFITAKALPEDLQKVLAGPHAGDIRLYEGQDGICYVLHIREVIPSKPQPYADARQSVRTIVFGKKLSQSMEEWIRKLKESSDVKVYFAGFKEQ